MDGSQCNCVFIPAVPTKKESTSLIPSRKVPVFLGYPSFGPVPFAVQSITMCGRFRLSRTDKQIAEHFDIPDEIEWSPRYNIAPAQRVAVVRQNQERPVRQLSVIRWGLIPSWAKDANIGYKMINARAETVA
jgi:hypothetical protein